MPWTEFSVMDERVRFVARLREGEKMAALCREFAISRKTGYKVFDRYKASGLEALTDRSRRPWRYGNQLPQQVEAAILNCQREKPHWGARKIRTRPSTGGARRKFILPPPASIAACRNLIILFTTRPSTSPTADESVSTAKRSISAPSLRGRL